MSATFDSQPAIIRGLCDPTSYPHPTGEVELLQTHISWVLLAGEFAYKIKKPVNLGFVDFSTLEKRKFFCHEELRLNRRLAESLYLAVLPIHGTPEHPRIGEASAVATATTAPLEFAVKMRRFPHDAELVQVLERRELTAEHIDNLASTVADFHSRISVAPVEKEWGQPAEVIRPVRENFEHLQADATSVEQRTLIAMLAAWSEQEFQRLESEFMRRKQSGFIRECHGDMHLGNMLLENDQVVIFDCLEFNEKLRWVDVQSEIAFLAMDLEDRARKDLANRFLNAYLELTGDYDGVPLLPYYQTYRAVVRAKVAFLRARQASQDNADIEELQRCHQEATSYLELAQKYTNPPAPILFVTHGLSGSGKTHATQVIVEEWGAVRLRSDVERKRLAGLAPGESSRSALGGGLYSSELTHRTYQRLKQLATRILKGGRSVIIDATNLRHEQRTLFRDLARKLGLRHIILEFTAPIAVLRERVAHRQQAGNDASEATVAVLERQLQEIEPLDKTERLEAVSIDTTSPEANTKFREALVSRLHSG